MSTSPHSPKNKNDINLKYKTPVFNFEKEFKIDQNKLKRNKRRRKNSNDAIIFTFNKSCYNKVDCNFVATFVIT